LDWTLEAVYAEAFSPEAWEQALVALVVLAGPVFEEWMAEAEGMCNHEATEVDGGQQPHVLH